MLCWVLSLAGCCVLCALLGAGCCAGRSALLGAAGSFRGALLAASALTTGSTVGTFLCSLGASHPCLQSQGTRAARRMTPNDPHDATLCPEHPQTRCPARPRRPAWRFVGTLPHRKAGLLVKSQRAEQTRSVSETWTPAEVGLGEGRESVPPNSPPSPLPGPDTPSLPLLSWLPDPL